MTVPSNVLRAARELLGIKQVTAAEAAGISRRTIQRLEAGELDQRHTSVVLQTYYEKQGIVFVPPAEGMGWGLFDNAHNGRAKE